MAIVIVHEPDAVVSSLNPILFRFTSDEADEPNFFVKLDVILHTDEVETEVTFIEYPIRSDGLVEFDLQESVRAFLDEVDYNKNILDPESVRNVTTGRLCTFKVTATEMYGEPPVAIDDDKVEWLSGEYGIAVRGGFAFEQWPAETYLLSFLTGDREGLPWLTWCPSKMIISNHQPLFLSFFSTLTYADNVLLRVMIMYTDATEDAVELSHSMFAFYYYEYCISPDFLGLDSIHPTKTIESFTVQLITQDDEVISQKRTYIIDYKKHANERFLLFRNSLSGLDTLRLTGEGTFNAEYSSDQVELIKGKYDRSEGKSRTINSEEQAGRIANTGWISRAEVNWIRDLYISVNRYEMVNEKPIPVRITSKKMALPEEADHNALTIEWQNQFKNPAYTPFYFD